MGALTVVLTGAGYLFVFLLVVVGTTLTIIGIDSKLNDKRISVPVSLAVWILIGYGLTFFTEVRVPKIRLQRPRIELSGARQPRAEFFQNSSGPKDDDVDLSNVPTFESSSQTLQRLGVEEKQLRGEVDNLKKGLQIQIDTSGIDAGAEEARQIEGLERGAADARSEKERLKSLASGSALMTLAEFDKANQEANKLEKEQYSLGIQAGELENEVGKLETQISEEEDRQKGKIQPEDIKLITNLSARLESIFGGQNVVAAKAQAEDALRNVKQSKLYKGVSKGTFTRKYGDRRQQFLDEKIKELEGLVKEAQAAQAGEKGTGKMASRIEAYKKKGLSEADAIEQARLDVQSDAFKEKGGVERFVPKFNVNVPRVSEGKNKTVEGLKKTLGIKRTALGKMRNAQKRVGAVNRPQLSREELKRQILERKEATSRLEALERENLQRSEAIQRLKLQREEKKRKGQQRLEQLQRKEQERVEAVRRQIVERQAALQRNATERKKATSRTETTTRKNTRGQLNRDLTRDDDDDSDS